MHLYEEDILLMKLKWAITAIFILLILFLTSMATLGQDDDLKNPQINTNQMVTNSGVNADKYSRQPDLVVKADSLVYYGISKEDGLLFSADAGNTWEPRNEGLPKKLIYPFQKAKVRYLTDLGVDCANPARIAVLTATNIYLSEDYGKTWSLILRKRPVPEGAYLTAVALSPTEKNTILLGTSFAGIFETTDRGQTWVNISRDLKFLYQGSDYWEEIAAVAYQRDNPAQIIFRCGFGQGVYQFSKDRKNATQINYPIPRVLDQLQSAATTNNPVAAPLDADIANQLYKNGNFKTEVTEDSAKEARLHTAANHFGIYIRSDKARGKSLDEKISLIKKNGLNAMVIDFKDDFGFLTYNTKLAWPRQMGAVRKNGINIEELLMKAKRNGIYVIGRIVTFQDPELFRYQNYKYAVWDQERNKPWHTREYWVDPFAQDVWEYNRAIAEELQNLGVDEIQFDYIRFPTDGDISRITFRYHPAGAEKSDALESFLAYARERITIPISTDLYGFSCWCRSLSSNGQNLESIADYVDVICPMYYPSHFPGSFMPGVDYLARARKIYYDGTNRAYSIVEGRSIVRPYVQAFRLGKELKMTAPVYTQYLLRQIQGNLATVSPGFTLWDYSNSYYMVTQSLGGLLKENQERDNE
jgi:hypothetical protein